VGGPRKAPADPSGVRTCNSTVGSVNANRRHYQAAGEAFERRRDDVKVVIDLTR
jgi:hypothetical protein